MEEMGIEFRTSMAEVNHLLFVSLPSDLSDAVLKRITKDVTQRVTVAGIRGVILNLSIVTQIDLAEFRLLQHLAMTNSLMHVPTVMMGIRPGIAAYLAQMPINLQGMIFRANMASALQACRRFRHARA
jgi:anti-anti-sigma regulatory factor